MALQGYIMVRRRIPSTGDGANGDPPPLSMKLENPSSLSNGTVTVLNDSTGVRPEGQTALPSSDKDEQVILIRPGSSSITSSDENTAEDIPDSDTPSDQSVTVINDSAAVRPVSQ